MIELIERWEKLWSRIPHEGDIWKLFGEIVVRYSEPHRIYHTLGHIRHCLEELDRVRHLCLNPDCVELGLMFHDSDYRFFQPDNEEASAAFSREELAKLKVDPGFIAGEERVILATKHAGVPEDPDACLAADIDLSIMGYPESEWLAAEKRIFWEFDWVPREIGRIKRAEALNGFLSREHIFLTDHFREKYETQARKNLKASVGRLEENV